MQSRLWITLGGAGVVMVIAGVLISMALAHAGQAGRQKRTLFQRLLGPLQLRLTIALMIMMATMVGVLELLAIPIERGGMEDMLKNALTMKIEWIAHAASNSSDLNLSSLLRRRTPSPLEMMDMVQSLDLERLQELADDARGRDVAYVALVNNEGEIVLSDQLALVDESAPVPADTVIQEAVWRDSVWRAESVWLVSTPLRQGEGGKQLGALQVAVRRERVEDFLRESRRLFLLASLVAMLAGVLAAQAMTLIPNGAPQRV